MRRDGMIFASGYYPEPEDPAAYTKAYVQKEIDYYEENGPGRDGRPLQQRE